MSKIIFVLLLSLMPAPAQALTLKTPDWVNFDTDKLIFEFSEPMISFGRMERSVKDVPIEISPSIGCEWRWLNRKTLACFFEAKRLKPATEYTMSFGTFTAADGQTFSPEQAAFRVPEITVVKEQSRFYQFKNPTRPEWVVKLSGPGDGYRQTKQITFNNDVGAEYVAYNSYSRLLYLMPKKDLPRNAEYTVEYKGQEIGRGKTMPPLGVAGIGCDIGGWNYKQYAADEEARCRSNVRIVMTDSIVQDNIKDFIKNAENKNYLNPVIQLSGLKNGQTTEIVVPVGIRDQWDETLKEPVTLKLHMLDREPKLKTVYERGVLEAAEQTDFHGFAQNLNKAAIEFKGFTAKKNVQGTHRIADIKADIRNEMYPFTYGIRDMLGEKSGYLFGRIQTNPEKLNDYSQKSFTAIVAPWQAVVKAGSDKTIVWVNDLKTGKPVKDAAVDIYVQEGRNPSADVHPILQAKTDFNGVAELGGYKALGKNADLLDAWMDGGKQLFVRIVKGEDMTVLPLSNSYAISAGAVSDWTISTVYGIQPRQNLRAFGITPQGIYRQGDTVDYKIYVRAEGLKSAPQAVYDLQVFDSMGQVVHERKNIALSEFGAIDGSFKLSAKAVAGTYDVQLKTGDTVLNPLKILVSDFAPLPFKVKTDVDTERAKGGEFVQMSATASLLSGGAFANADARQTAVLSYVPFGYENFSFGNGDFPHEETLRDKTKKTNGKGEVHTSFKLPKSRVETGEIRFETRVFDDSGRFGASIKVVPYFASDALVGIRPENWLVQAGVETAVDVVVVSPDKKPVADIPVKVEIYKKSGRLIRERAAGNAYRLRYDAVEEKVSECALVSADEPVKCAFTPQDAGEYRAAAVIAGSSAKTSFYAEGGGYVPWEPNKDVLPLTVDRKKYAVGETIEIMVKNPFQNGRALITVERDGILKSWVQPMKNSMEKVKIEVTEDFFPGVYVSVNLFSPRVADSSIEPDLGKPSEKTGYVQIDVENKTRVLDVKITSDKEEYRPKQTAKVTLSVQAKQPVELAVAVLDEAVLALLPKGIESFNPLPELNKTGDLNVKTYSLISQLIGRQKVEKKGANQGGDGGSDFAVRDLFKLVGYWNPSLKTDKDGKASFDMTLPDNLTSWKIIAVAMTPSDFAGLGTADFKVNQPLELRALIPNQVYSGDTFVPAVSVMNRTKVPQTVEVTLKSGGEKEIFKPYKNKAVVILKPFERKAVFFDSVTAGEKGKMPLLFAAKSGKEKDALKVEIPVLKNAPEQTAAMFGRIDGTEEIPLDIPADSVLTLSVSPTVANAKDSAIKAMIEYPYSCWEQKISRAWAAANAGEKWAGGREFAQSVLDEIRSYQTPDGGMSYFVNFNGFDSPYLSAYTSYVLTRLKAKGFAVPPVAEEKLGAYLLRIFNGRKDVEMPTVVRALSVPYLIKRGLIETADLEPLRRDLPKMTAFEKAVLYPYMPTDLLKDVYKTSGAVVVEEDEEQSFSVLPSIAKTNCAVLQALPENRELMRGVLSLRGKNGTWGETQANAFCLDALDAYMAASETAVDAKISAKIGKKQVLDGTVAAKELKTAISFEQPETQTLTMTKTGQGNPYYSAVLNYPSSTNGAVNAGLKVKRFYSVEQGGHFFRAQRRRIRRGQTVRVILEVTVPEFQSYVAVSDPVVGALEPLNSLQTDMVRRDGFYFKDSNFKRVTFYAEELPKGTYTLTYDAQVVAEGDFIAYPAKAEAMYLPDVFGLSETQEVVVQ